MITQYIFITIFITWIVLFVYIKIRFPFWNIQPVFHTYDYWRYFYWTPFIVYRYLPIKTKYCDFEEVFTENYSECSQDDKNNLVNLLQCYYLPSDRILHTIKEKHVHSYLTGYGEPTFVSFFKEKHFNKKDLSGNTEIVTSEIPVGCITSRPTRIFFRPTLSEDVYTESIVYFIDFLCVNRERDIKKISRKLLQTHEYNQRKKNPNIKVSLIKKEIDLFDGVVPCIQYNTTTFYLRNIKFPQLPMHYQVVRVLKENQDLLADFLYIQTKTNFKTADCLFDFCVIPEIGSLISLINSELLYVYVLKSGDQIYGIYFIKDLKTQYEDIEGDTLECIASVSNSYNYNLFYLGFLHSLQHIIKNKKNYKMLLFDEIGHNLYLLENWRKRHSPIFTNLTAYYLFNYIYPRTPLESCKCFVLL